MSPYKVSFHPEAKKELDRLDGSVKQLVLKQIATLQESPTLGEKLGNKAGFDLTGYWKIYAYKKKNRIVYRIHEGKLLVFVIAVGKREDMEVYGSALERKSKEEEQDEKGTGK